MEVVFFFSLIALLLTILDSRQTLKNGMKYAFFIVTIISAIRYNYGNDYMSYQDNFTLIGKYSISDIIFLQEKMQFIDSAFKDIGAAILYRICKPIGFIGFIALITIFQGCVYYQFINENVPRKYYWLAVFIYLFDFNNYVLQMSMIRQALVIALFVWSWHFIRQGKYLVPILITLVSFTIHKSSIVLAPFVFLSMLSYKNGKVLTIVTLGLTGFFWLAAGTIGDMVGNVMDLELFQLYNDSYAMEETGGIGMARLLLAFVPYLLVLVYFMKPQTKNGPRFLVFLSVVGTIILPFSFVIAMMSRLTYYFNIFMVAAIPITLTSVRRPILRLVPAGIFMLLTLYQYFDLFLHSVYTKSYATFDSIFSAL